MEVELLKLTGNEWIVVPGGNNVHQLIDLINKTGIDELKNNNIDFLINDKNGEPDIMKASEIISRYIKVDEILFQLYKLDKL